MRTVFRSAVVGGAMVFSAVSAGQSTADAAVTPPRDGDLPGYAVSLEGFPIPVFSIRRIWEVAGLRCPRSWRGFGGFPGEIYDLRTGQSVPLMNREDVFRKVGDLFASGEKPDFEKEPQVFDVFMCNYISRGMELRGKPAPDHYFGLPSYTFGEPKTEP